MRMRAMVVGAVATLALAGLASPANANTSVQDWNRCPNGKSCYFDYPLGEGRMETAPRPGWFDLRSINFRDQVGSVNNRGGGTVTFYDCVDFQCSSYYPMVSFAPGTSGNLNFYEDRADLVYI